MMGVCAMPHVLDWWPVQMQSCADTHALGMSQGWFVALVSGLAGVALIALYCQRARLKRAKAEVATNLRIVLGAGQVLSLLSGVLKLVFPTEARAALGVVTIFVAGTTLSLVLPGWQLCVRHLSDLSCVLQMWAPWCRSSVKAGAGTESGRSLSPGCPPWHCSRLACAGCSCASEGASPSHRGWLASCRQAGSYA